MTGNGRDTTVSTENHEVCYGNVLPRVLIVEDVRHAEPALKAFGYDCVRLTHNEVMSSEGSEHTGKLLNGTFSILWISTPHDWYSRTKKATSVWQRLNNWIKIAISVGIVILLFGPPGFLWNNPNIKETLEGAKFTTTRMRLCHFGDKFDNKSQSPSGSYLQLATNMPLDSRIWQCRCKISIQDHVLDWYGRSQEQAEWRKKISANYISKVCKLVKDNAIKDSKTPPSQIRSSSTSSTTQAFPTEARIRQKAYLKDLKEKGLKPKKRKTEIEFGNDDCGDDISGLGPDITLLGYDTYIEPIDSSDDEDMFYFIPMPQDNTTNVFTAIAHLCYGRDRYVDILELCGGKGKISNVAFRRGLSSGGNLDLVTGCDLGLPEVQKAVKHYVMTCYVLVVVLQPSCRSVGAFSSYNAVHHYDTWHQHHLEDLPHIKFCGEIALLQSQLNRFWIREQPAPSWIDSIPPWTQVKEKSTAIMEQCMTGAKDDYGCAVQKRTRWDANHESLVAPFRKYRCDHNHIHGNPTGEALHRMQEYTWRLCGVVVTGIADLKKIVSGNVYIFPTASTNTEASTTPIPRPPPGGLGCPACANKIRNDSVQHTRNPATCRHHNVTPVKWSCPACQDDKGRNSRRDDIGHTFAEEFFDNAQHGCRFAPPTVVKREGQHPREPRPMVNSHPSAEASSLDAATAGSGDAPAEASSSGAASSSGHGNVLAGEGRGPDTAPRTRRTYADTGSGQPTFPDWSRFDIKISLKSLQSYAPSVVIKELRKLHLRWWHAREPKMRELLSAAGVDEARLAMIKGVVDTCRECRAWQKRGNDVLPSTSLATKFNEAGEVDLMYYKKFIGFHIIDRAIRLSDGCQIYDKHTDTLLNAYTTSWVQRNGAFESLYCDGEMGFNNEKAISELSRLGTELRVRASGQHARLVEARNSMLRHIMHMIEEDLRRHGHDIPFSRLLSESIFVVNAFSFYNGVTPYNCHTGRQPACLPQLANIDFPSAGTPSDGSREQRIREASLNAVTQATAEAKTKRALAAKTTIDGGKTFKIGDQMDYHRPTPTKDEHGGWVGPCTVTANEPDRGIVVCQHGSRKVRVWYPDARLSLYIEAIFMAQAGMDSEAMDLVTNFIEKLGAGKPAQTFGYTRVSSTFTLTQASKNAPKVHLALQFLVRNFFRVDDVFAIRLAKSVHKLSPCPHADRCVLIYYNDHLELDFQYYETRDITLDIPHVTCSNKARVIQCLVKTGCQSEIDTNTEMVRELMPTSTPNTLGNLTGGSGNVPPNQVPEETGDLPTIEEETEEEDENLIDSFYAELLSDEPLAQDPEYEEKMHIPVHMMPEDTLLFTVTGNGGSRDPDVTGNGGSEAHVLNMSCAETCEEDQNDIDEIGPYTEICFTEDMAPVVLDEKQLNYMQKNDVATIRVYHSQQIKRAVVVKEDDLLNKNDMIENAKAVADATKVEIKKWLDNKCFHKHPLKDAQNLMTSRYVAKWKWVKDPKLSTWQKIIRMRLVLRGLMDLEAFSLDTFSGTAKRTSQRILASEAACHENWIIASLDIDTAFLKGFTYKELAEATGEKERTVCFQLPPGSAAVLRQFPGFEDYDETKHCLGCDKPGTGTKDAPRAFSLKLHKTTLQIGLQPTSFDPEFEIKKDLLTAKHVDDINMAGTEASIDEYTAQVEKVFGKCKLNKRQFTNCGVQYTLLANGDIQMDQDEYIKTLRPIMHSELTGAKAESPTTKTVSELFVSLRGALAYTTLTQAWIQVYVVSMQRVQWPTNLEVRRLNAVTRKLQAKPQKLLYPAMKCSGTTDLHTDSGYRRMVEVEDVKGYGMRGLCLLRRGIRRYGVEAVIHLLDSICRSHKLTIRSSYGAEALAAAHGVEDAFPTLVTIAELTHGVLSPLELKNCREKGGLRLKVILTTDAESVYKSLTSRDLKVPTEKTLLGHVSWIRELLQLELIDTVQWCDTRDMVADGHTKGSIERALLLKLMAGKQNYVHNVKSYSPHRGTTEPPVHKKSVFLVDPVIEETSG